MGRFEPIEDFPTRYKFLIRLLVVAKEVRITLVDESPSFKCLSCIKSVLWCIATFSSHAASAEMQYTKVMQAVFSGFNECSFHYFGFDFNRGNPCEILVYHSQFPHGFSSRIGSNWSQLSQIDVAHFAGSLTRNWPVWIFRKYFIVQHVALVGGIPIPIQILYKIQIWT